MPKTKKTRTTSSSDSDSGPEDRYPAKKQKAEPKSSSSLPKNSEGEFAFELSKNRTVTVKDFKGRVFVNIREFYMDSSSGEMRPGKKGIALNVEQWTRLKEQMEEIDRAVKESS